MSLVICNNVLCQDEMVRGFRGWRNTTSPGRRLSSSSRFVFVRSSKIVRDAIAEPTGRRDSEQRRPHSQLRRPDSDTDVQLQSERNFFVDARSSTAATAAATASRQSSTFRIVVFAFGPWGWHWWWRWKSSSSQSFGVISLPRRRLDGE